MMIWGDIVESGYGGLVAAESLKTKQFQPM